MKKQCFGREWQDKSSLHTKQSQHETTCQSQLYQHLQVIALQHTGQGMGYT